MLHLIFCLCTLKFGNKQYTLLNSYFYSLIRFFLNKYICHDLTGAQKDDVEMCKSTWIRVEFICLHLFWLFWSFSFPKIVKMVTLSNTYFHFNTFKMVNSATVNCHSATVKSHFRFFYLTKHYFNFKSNHFKFLYLNTHSHSNTFKMVNSFYQFQIRMGMTINKQAIVLRVWQVHSPNFTIIFLSTKNICLPVMLFHIYFHLY